jgi:hypothetical protein
MGSPRHRRAAQRRRRAWLLAAIALLALVLPLVVLHFLMRPKVDGAPPPRANDSFASLAPSSFDAPLAPPMPSPNQPPLPRPPVKPGPRSSGGLDFSATILDGVVVERITGRAIAGASVSAWLPRGTDRTVTNASGEFSLVLACRISPDDPPAVPEVSVEHPSYVERRVTWAPPLVAEGVSPTRIELERGVRLGGRVVATGGGAADVKLRVTAFAGQPCDLGRRVLFTQATRSRDDGSFAFEPLPSTPFVEVTVESDGVCVHRITDIALTRHVENLLVAVDREVARRAQAWAALSPAERTRADRKIEYEAVDMQIFLVAAETNDPLVDALVIARSDRGGEQHFRTTTSGQLSLPCPRGTLLLTLATPGFDSLQVELDDGAFVSPAILTLQRRQ